MNILVFGTGKIYKKYLNEFKIFNILALLDNDVSKQGEILDGYLVEMPDNISKYQYDYVIIAAKAYKAVRKQLMQIGVPSDVIIDRDHKSRFPIYRIVEEKNVLAGAEKTRGKILMIAHDMSYTGASLMLYNMGRVFKKNAYDVCVYAKSWGKITGNYLEEGIHVHRFEDFNFREDEISLYFSGYDMIIVNTVVLYELVQRLKILRVPIVWWIHEQEDAYYIYDIDTKKISKYMDLHVYGVGKRAINAYKKMVVSKNIRSLLYGIDYEGSSFSFASRDKLVFALIGTVCKGKGHDIYIEAIKRNWHSWNKSAQFIIVGSMTEAQRDELDGTGVVQVIGEVSHDRMMEIYDSIDIVVCPSRYDTMPVVLTEGMMHKKVCIASEATGTSEFIKNHYNGLICKAGDVDSLSECIQWIIKHQDKIDEIGNNAFHIYQEYFSMEIFEKNVMNIVHKYIQ